LATENQRNEEEHFMAFKYKLLTTAAIPLMALAWMEPASATALVRTDAPFQAQSQVINVQSDEDELLKQQQKKERREQRQKKNQQDGAAQGDQQDNGNGQKRKKNAEAQDQQKRQKVQQDDSQEVVPQKRKKNTAAAEEPLVKDVPQDAEQVTPRRKKNAAAAEEQQMQQSDDTQQMTPRKKKNAAAADEQQMQQPDDGEQVQPRKKKNAAAEEQQNSNGSVEEVQTPKRKKNAEAQDDQSGNNAAAEQPERVRKRKEIAADPSKTTDTVELPVKNGAAVLDSDKDADKRGDGSNRERRKREREEAKPARVPKSDKDAQAGFKGDNGKPVRPEPVLREKGDGRVVIRDDDRGRLGRRGETRYERLDNGRIREVVIRPDGDRVVTIRNRYGEIIRRSRIDSRDREVVIFYSPLLERGRDRLYLRDAGYDLPPMRLRVPLREYIVDVSSEPDRDYEEFLSQPPVEPVERVYSVDEVKYSARIRDKVRRIDLDTITFETGSAEIDMGQASSLKRVGAAIKDILDRDPGETFLIEGHTDAVGSDESNLVLSDSRAESVANVLSDMFDIPAENLVTQGYGERFLKVDTDAPERMNRRVTIRRITSLVRPMASNEE
jgi:outer membrane protein OmpA-like peptidoglycan-associated protein